LTKQYLGNIIIHENHIKPSKYIGNKLTGKPEVSIKDMLIEISGFLQLPCIRKKLPVAGPVG
jgi:hypothetical protein